MRKLITHFYCLLVLMQISWVAEAQDFTNRGKDFWIGYGNHVKMYANSEPETMSLYITSTVSTSGTVAIDNLGINIPFTVTANNITTINIPRSAGLTQEGLSKNAIHVTSLHEIVVYAHIYANNVSGATLCLPTNTLGREYYSINFTQRSNEASSYSYFFVIATEDNTIIEITPAAATLNGWTANSIHTLSLNKGEIYQVLSTTDLTGSTIKSIASGVSGCRRIAVYSGSGKIAISGGPCLNNTADNLFQQAYPTSTWGKKYIAVPSSDRLLNVYRIIKSIPGTNVSVNGKPVPATSFIDNFYYEFSASGNVVIEGDQPIMTAQYFTSQNCNGNPDPYDPEMIFLNPVEQNLTSVTLNSTPNYRITDHFINIVIKNEGTALSSIRLDGNANFGTFFTLQEDTLYSYCQINVGEGTHNLSSDSGFNAIAYGFGDAESYGYSAGTNLRDLYQFVSIQNQYARINFAAACKGSPFEISMVLPYQPLMLKWQFNGLLRDTTIMSPVFDSSWTVNDRTLYRFTIKKYYAISEPGSYPISIIVNNPTTDGCSGEQKIDFELRIFETPEADFSFSFSGCMKDTALFADISNTEGRGVISRFWDFGDGRRSSAGNEQAHSYLSAGNYTTKFVLMSDVGCLSDTVYKTIGVSELPRAFFTLPPIKCDSTSVVFTNLSSVASGNITKWNWNFGDGNSSNESVGRNIYTSPGLYNVSLDLESDQGCKSDIFSLPLKINPRPVAYFGALEICLNDASAVFTDSSRISDNSASEFLYAWNFGDAGASASNPNTSVLKDPKHIYYQAATYDVSLRVTSKDGCTDDTTIVFTVNGSSPQADFEIMDEENLCSNAPVFISDKSSVDFGNISRVEIYWDYLNDPLKKTVDENPVSGKQYSFLYDNFGSPSSKTFQINYVAYSGVTCISQLAKTVMVNASPQIVFDALAAVCSDQPSFQISGARELNGLQNGIYSGDGINASGIFNPAAAGVGPKILSYRVSSAAGCIASKEQTIQVNPPPFVDAGPDRTILEGASIKLNARANGENLTYTWEPDTFLDNPRVLNPVVSPLAETIYTLKVRSSLGCTAEDEMRVKIVDELRPPNVFSPNGDGINDTWEIPYLADFSDCEVEIFNRFGQKLYQSVGYNRPWNGKVNGNSVPFGTYYWVIKFRNGRPPVNGSVTIIR